MTYSRSRTQFNRRSRRRRTLRNALWSIGLIACIAVAGTIAWANFRGDPAPAVSSPDGSPAASEDPGRPAGTASPSQTDGGTEPAGASPEPDPVDPEPSSSPAESEGAADGDGRVTIAFVGDVLPAAIVEERMKEHGYDYPYREARPYLEAADIAAGNLETPISTRGAPMENKKYVYRGSPDALPALVDAGFDYFALANNHTLDFGWDALSDTMGLLDDAGLQHSGAGIDDKEAFTPAYIERDGMTIAFVSLSHVVPVVEWKADRNTPGVAETYSTERALAAIELASSNADLVVVMVHWGKELADRPLDINRDYARAYIDAGADLVVGSHPHVLQGFESYNGKWIAYSLGNFVFPGMPDERTAQSGILQADCGKDGDCGIRFLPMIATASQPAVPDAETSQTILARLADISYSVRIGEDGHVVAEN